MSELKIDFISRTKAESIVPTPDMAIISIREPAEWVNLKNGWADVLKLEFHDFDPSTGEAVCIGTGLPYDAMVAFGPDQAKQVISFANKQVESGVKTLLVHCYAGISRSAAVAKYLNELFTGTGVAIAKNYRLEGYELYNKHVYRTLINQQEGMYESYEAHRPD